MPVSAPDFRVVNIPADVPAFMERLRRLDSVSALALEWTILTAVRTNEAAEAPRAAELHTDIKNHCEHEPPAGAGAMGAVIDYRDQIRNGLVR